MPLMWEFLAIEMSHTHYVYQYYTAINWFTISLVAVIIGQQILSTRTYKLCKLLNIDISNNKNIQYVYISTLKCWLFDKVDRYT